MLTAQQPIFRKYWHATVPMSALRESTTGVVPFTLLGEALAIFLDEHGKPAALKDRCCHRTAKLTKGWCTNGALQCGYHGWTYNRDGRVIRIPQYDASREIPTDYCTPAYRAVERYGYVWIALEEPIAPIFDVPEFDHPSYRTVFQFYERWATSPLRALENSFDNAHFSFVHRKTFGVSAQPKPSKYEITENELGFAAETIIDAANPTAFHRVSGSTDAMTRRHMRNAWYLPFSRRLDIEYPSGIRHIIINCYTPIDDGNIQLIQWLFRNDREEDCPAQLLIDFDFAITREDQDMLESTDPDALVDLRRRGIEYSMDSDKPGMLIRKRFMELLAKQGEAEIHN